jgi:hypothetical protein
METETMHIMEFRTLCIYIERMTNTILSFLCVCILVIMYAIRLKAQVFNMALTSSYLIRCRLNMKKCVYARRLLNLL